MSRSNNVDKNGDGGEVGVEDFMVNLKIMKEEITKRANGHNRLSRIIEKTSTKTLFK